MKDKEKPKCLSLENIEYSLKYTKWLQYISMTIISPHLFINLGF